MSYFKSFTDLLYTTPNATPVEGAFSGMKDKHIAETAGIFKEENIALKERLLLAEKENRRLKELLTGSKGTTLQSYSEYLFVSLKSVLEMESPEEKSFEQSSFQSFLFNQLAFGEGLEEDDVYSLNHWSNKKVGDAEITHEMFSFQQKILERNYQQLFRNILASKGINFLLKGDIFTTKATNNKENKDNQSQESIESSVQNKRLSTSALSGQKKNQKGNQSNILSDLLLNNLN